MNWSLVAAMVADDRLRDLTTSLACGGIRGGLRVSSAGLCSWGRAAGGSSKHVRKLASCLVPSWPLMSVEEAGVRSSVG